MVLKHRSGVWKRGVLGHLRRDLPYFGGFWKCGCGSGVLDFWPFLRPDFEENPGTEVVL